MFNDILYIIFSLNVSSRWVYLRVKLRKPKKLNEVPKLPNLKEKYTGNAKRKYGGHNGNSEYKSLRDSLVTSANDVIPKECRRKRKKKMNG